MFLGFDLALVLAPQAAPFLNEVKKRLSAHSCFYLGYFPNVGFVVAVRFFCLRPSRISMADS
jgi:hypothetical protein